MPETYVHRIGRTGRAGAAGIALSFCSREEKAFLKDIEKLIDEGAESAEALHELAEVKSFHIRIIEEEKRKYQKETPNQ